MDTKRKTKTPPAVDWVEALNLSELEAAKRELEEELEILRIVINAKLVKLQQPHRNGKPHPS